MSRRFTIPALRAFRLLPFALLIVTTFEPVVWAAAGEWVGAFYEAFQRHAGSLNQELALRLMNGTM